MKCIEIINYKIIVNIIFEFEHETFLLNTMMKLRSKYSTFTEIIFIKLISRHIHININII
jgi:hypothetical protein